MQIAEGSAYRSRRRGGTEVPDSTYTGCTPPGDSIASYSYRTLPLDVTAELPHSTFSRESIVQYTSMDTRMLPLMSVTHVEGTGALGLG